MHGFACFQVIREDLATDLKHLLKARPESINCTDNAGNTPMHVASKYNRIRSMAILLQNNAGKLCFTVKFYSDEGI